MRFLHEEKHDLPLVHAEVVVGRGATEDPDGVEGLAHHAAELMRRGAGGRSRAELDAALDAVGATLDVEASHDDVSFTARCLARNLPALASILGEILCRPHLDSDEHERLVRETLGLLDEIRDDDSVLCTRFFERFALAGHKYGRPVIGTERSLAELSGAHARDWVSRAVARRNLIVGFAGDVREGVARELVDAALAPLADGGAPSRPDHGAPALPSGRRTYLIDKPERQQSQILIGHAAPRHADPQWLPLHVGATVFGGMFTSRLMTEVRVKRGWSYGAGCRVGRSRFGGSFRIRVFPSAEQTPDTLALVLSMWEEIAANGITDDELRFAKSYLEGNWAFEIDTPAKRLDHAIDEITFELPPGTYASFLDRLRAVTRDEVNAAIRNFWHPERGVVVITCTADSMRPRLAKVPLGELDVVGYDSY